MQVVCLHVFNPIHLNGFKSTSKLKSKSKKKTLILNFWFLFSFDRVVSAAAGTGASNWHRHPIVSFNVERASPLFLFFCRWSSPPSSSPSPIAVTGVGFRFFCFPFASARASCLWVTASHGIAHQGWNPLRVLLSKRIQEGRVLERVR
ncbi:uncharacterized protein LOC107638684 [Arachis ipaensis]|uniref:uncharacterized protein LOC107638684 n=1 Tax=Arachis ipaensis TaxID=130454 RepID=UPI000A2AF494|nr:uncharacterized protein LOC107638684 [Arachis ipaensis]